MPARYFFLREDEDVLLRLRARPVWAIVLLTRPIVLLTFVLAAALVARMIVPQARVVPEWVPWAVWGALVVLAAFAAWRRSATTEYALTDERIYARTGRLVTRVQFTTHDKITDIHYRQGPLERMFGLATLTFATAGGEVHVAGVRDALALKAASERARDAFIRTLLREAPAPSVVEPATAAPSAPEADAMRAPVAQRVVTPPWTGPRPDYLQAGDTPVWYEKPRLVVALGGLRSVLGLIPVLLFSRAIDDAWRPLVYAAAVAFVALSVGTRFLQVKRTEYVATDRRIYARTGVLGTNVSQLTYDKITDIAYNQDLLGRILGYGTVTVQTAGGSQAPISMIGLADPLAAKETIEGWRDTSLGGSA